jgi:hypothetical protein
MYPVNWTGAGPTDNCSLTNRARRRARVYRSGSQNTIYQPQPDQPAAVELSGHRYTHNLYRSRLVAR